MSEEPEDTVKGRDGLTVREKLFVREYLSNGFNKSKAAADAGYKIENYDSLRRYASQLSKKPHIEKAIQKQISKRMLALDLSVDDVFLQMSRLAMSDIRALYTTAGDLKRIEELPDDTAAAVQSVKVTKRPSVDENGEKSYENVVEYKLADKTRALEQMAKYLKMFIDRIDVSGEVTHKGLKELLDDIDGSNTGLPSDD